MNWNNKYSNDQDCLNHRLFPKVQHSSIINRTKTTLNGPNVEIIKNNTLPVPIISIKYKNKIKDPVKEFIKAKSEHEHEKRLLGARLTRYYRTGKISREKDITSRNLKQYITNKLLDPVPYLDPFDCFYYYPHHGTLKCLETEDDKDYLVSVGGNEGFRFDQICDKMPFKGLNADSQQSYPTELIMNDTSDFIAAKYRNTIKIGKLPDPGTVMDGKVIESNYDFKHKNDIFASSLNDINLSTIDSKYRLRRLNLVHRYEDVDVKLTDYFFDENLLPISMSTPKDSTLTKNCASFTTRYNFGIIDFRNKKKVALVNYFKSSDDLMLKCEKIFNHVNSELSKDLVYIASSHVLYTYDYRNLKEPVVYWTHQLYDPPMMLSTTMYGLNEIICASSHMAGDLKVCNNNGKSINYYPYKPYNIRSSYNKLREQGLFLLSENIQERVQGSISGISLHYDHIRSKIKLFTQNCYGDVYENVLKCKEGTKDEDFRSTIERFQFWENHLKVPINPNKKLTPEERVKNADLIVDDIVKLESLSKYLNDEKANNIVDLTNLEPEELPNFKATWKVNIGEARQCTDLLAKEIMYLWGDIDESFDDDGWEEINNVDIVNLTQDVKGTDKVSRWLESTQIDEDVEMEDEFSPEITSTQAATLPTPSANKRKSRIAGF
ncbi:uncharacterized protein TAF1C-like [Chironomus tepperi]|uniref:uncharacterized protein TAF1C-like n=1 Tax=Chironomus tepperi TaxID=113505 RepID=UPI00391EE842